MKLITPDQSAAIEYEIFRQALAIDALALKFAPPWGLLPKARMQRLYEERAATYFHSEPQTKQRPS